MNTRSKLADRNLAHADAHTHNIPMICLSVVNTVAFHPEGSCIASGGNDRTIKMWDVRSHLLVQHYNAHDDAVTALSMHPVGLITCLIIITICLSLTMFI